MSNVSRLPGPSADVWDWQRYGACRGRDSAQFFHPDGERGASRLRREIAAKAVCRSARYGPSAPPMPWPPASRTASGAASPRPSGYVCWPSGWEDLADRAADAWTSPAGGAAGPRAPVRQAAPRPGLAARRGAPAPCCPWLARIGAAGPGVRCRTECDVAGVQRTSADVDAIVCQPVAPSGAGSAQGCGLRLARRCRWPAPAACARRGVAVPRPRPQPPGVDRGDRGQRGLLPGAVVDPHLDLARCPGAAPRRPRRP